MTLPTRAGVLGLAAVLSATCLAMIPLPSAQAAGVDPTPATQSAAWLRSQLVGGVVQDPTTTPASVDVAASFDAALGFKVQGDAATSAAVRDALAPSIAGYVGIEPATKAGPLARATWFAQTLGAAPATYGGVDLPTRLADQVDATTGRLTDDVAVATPTVDAGSQSYAVSALATAGSATATPALAYLAALQCATTPTAAYFADELPAVGATPSCDVAKTPSVAATATAVIALAGLPAAQGVREKAVLWLASTQQNNGRWTPDGKAGSGDAATTSLAGYAVALGGRPRDAALAAVWVRGQQLANAGTCPGFTAADVGAVAFDSTSYDASTATPVANAAPGVRAGFLRSTARALALLPNAPAGDFGVATQLSVARFTRPGAGVVVNVRGSARNVLCATAPTLSPTRLQLAYDGTATYAFYAAAAGTTTTTVLDAAGQQSSATITTLPKAKLGLKFRSKRVRLSKTAVIKVSGLAPGESVKVKFRGQGKDSAIASSSGQAKLRFKVTGKRGSANVRVTGQYGNRNRTKSLLVVRR